MLIYLYAFIKKNMKAEECSCITEWDYLGNEVNGSYFYGDWVQTLITKINQVSAQIFKSSLIGGANRMSLNSKLYPLIKLLEYYNEETKLLAGRYLVVIDDNIEDNLIFVYREITDEEINSKEYPKYRIAEIGIDEYKKRLLGCVKIKNL